MRITTDHDDGSDKDRKRQQKNIQWQARRRTMSKWQKQHGRHHALINVQLGRSRRSRVCRILRQAPHKGSASYYSHRQKRGRSGPSCRKHVKIKIKNRARHQLLSATVYTQSDRLASDPIRRLPNRRSGVGTRCWLHGPPLHTCSATIQCQQ